MKTDLLGVALRYFLGVAVMLLVSALPSLAEAATLSVSPQTGVHTVGGVFSAQVRVNTGGEAINAAEGTLRFDPQKITVLSVSKGSIFNLWTADPTFSNSAGTISFGGGATPPGYSGSSGAVISITFKAQSAGDAKVSFTSGSVLAADGRGTNVLTSMGSAAFTIAAAGVPAEPEVIEYVAPANTPGLPSITSTSHPDPAAWYQATDATLNWSVPAGVTSVRTLIDGSSGSIPTKVYETPIRTISLDLEEGVQYFHLQFRNEDGWGRVAHYRLAVDTESPTQFDISLPDGADLSNPVQTLVLNTVDEPSGVSRYEVQLDGGEPYEYIDETGSSTITLPALSPGKHTVVIEAFDAAGNSRVATFSFTILSFDRPEFTEYPSRINTDVIPVISGVTRANAEVTVTVRKVSGSTEPQTYTMVSDEAGVFTFIPDSYFELGVYELTATAIDEFGAQSEESDPIRIAVEEPGYLQIGGFLVSVLSVLVPLLGLLILLILGLLYIVRRLRNIKSTVAGETEEALAVLRSEFAQLRATLRTESDELAASRKGGKLTKAETQLVEAVEVAMKESEQRVKKEVSDVDDIVS
ncbi:cohesin domain-containing protein [Candidatus Pacebacteria bacterium]|nr:cohesin domain-containing protein [Candidatus Paceibacterota bacterium]